MVDTALLVALIGIAGTLSASILTVLSDPWRKKKHREAKKESIRKALYSELARVAIDLHNAIGTIEAEEEHLKAVKIVRHDSEKAEKPLDYNSGSSKDAEILDSGLPFINKIVFENLVGGFFSVIRTDAELAILFYELPEADLVAALYALFNQFLGYHSALEDPKHTWQAFIRIVEIARDAFVHAYENGYVDITMLRRYCYLPSEIESLDELLKKPHAPLLKEYLEMS